MVRRRQPECGRRGQATVEFALMVPLLFALVFMCIEFALYFGAIHWDNYAAFVAARGVQVGEDPVSLVESTLLNGNVSSDASLSVDDSSATVQQQWRVDTPGLHQILQEMDFTVTAVLGSEEYGYEGQVNSQFADNNGGGLGR